MVAKLIPVFPFPEVRKNELTNSSNIIEEWIDVFNNLINSEINVDAGYPMDVFLFYRINGDMFNCIDYIKKFDGVATKNGTIHLLYSLNDKQIHGFDIIYEFLKLSKSKLYTHILYQEDDIQILNNVGKYVKKSINKLKEFKIISYSVAVDFIVPHIGGLFSLFPIKPLRKKLESFPLIGQINEIPINEWILNSLECKFEDISYIDYNNIPVNYENVKVFHQDYVKKNWILDKKFLFKVGK